MAADLAPSDPRNNLPEGLTSSNTILWGTAIAAHPIEWHPWFSWMALGEIGAARAAKTLTELMDQRERLLGVEEVWRPTARNVALVWWPTVGVMRRHWSLVERIRTDGARLGVYLHPRCQELADLEVLPD